MIVSIINESTQFENNKGLNINIWLYNDSIYTLYADFYGESRYAVSIINTQPKQLMLFLKIEHQKCILSLDVFDLMVNVLIFHSL